MEGAMDQDVKLIQIFLGASSTPAVFEVSTTQDGDLICNCPGYRGRRRCKHVQFVQARIDGNNGSYPLEISKRATQEEADKAQTSTELFREFIIKFGKIEVF
jgi:hypothetical protein